MTSTDFHGRFAVRLAVFACVVGPIVVAWSVVRPDAVEVLAVRAACRDRIASSVAGLSPVDFASAYDRDPSQLIDARLTLPEGVHECRVRVADASIVGAHVLRCIERDPSSLVDAIVPVELDRICPAGAFHLEQAPIGHKLVWITAPGCAPRRVGYNLVGDGAGVWKAEWKLTRARTTRVELDATYTRWSPLYESFWLGETWSPTAANGIDIEWRDPDGWPAGLLLDKGDGQVALLALTERDGALRAEEVWGPDARSIDGLGAAVYRTWRSVISRRRFLSTWGTPVPLRVGGVPSNGMVVVESDGRETWAFADRWGAVELSGVSPGGCVCWAVGSDGVWGNPAGIWTSSSTPELWCPRPVRNENPQRALEIGLYRRSAYVYGFLLDVDANPLPNGVVVALCLSHDDGRRHVTANQHGFYLLNDLTPGRRYLMLCDVQGARGQASVDLDPRPDVRGTRVDIAAR